jgi:hypothetical protein
MTGKPSDRERDQDVDDARWRAAWRATPAAPIPAGWQSALMEDVRARAAATRVPGEVPADASAAGYWWGSLAAAALLSVALGVATARGVDPRGDVLELALRAGDASRDLLHLPGAP